MTLGALFLAAGNALVVALAIHQETIWSFLPMVFVTYFPAWYLVLKFPRLKLAFISRRRFAEAVRDRAVLAFFEKRLHKTRHETGILIFISLFERRVWILGDRGINAKIPSDWWEKCALELAAGIREDRLCETLCAVIEKCGAELKRHFPSQATTPMNWPMKSCSINAQRDTGCTNTASFAGVSCPTASSGGSTAQCRNRYGSAVQMFAVSSAA